MRKDSRIFVAGYRGLVGSAIVRALKQHGCSNLILRSRAETDLRDAYSVDRLFAETRPKYVFLAAAEVDGVLANDTYPVDFLYDNLTIEMNVIGARHRHGVQKIQVLGSSCIYPKFAQQPLKEEYLLTGALEPTNEWYAVAKIAGIKFAQAYHKQYGLSAMSVMATNLYGPEDNLDLSSSHVLPALIRKSHEAEMNRTPEVVIWVNGSLRREFLYVDDLATTCLLLIENYDSSDVINAGTGEGLTIREVAELIAEVVGFRGTLHYDYSKPDGTPRKLLDVSKIRGLGWTPTMSLRDGLERTFNWYCQHSVANRGHDFFNESGAVAAGAGIVH